MYKWYRASFQVGSDRFVLIEESSIRVSFLDHALVCTTLRDSGRFVGVIFVGNNLKTEGDSLIEEDNTLGGELSSEMTFDVGKRRDGAIGGESLTVPKVLVSFDKTFLIASLTFRPTKLE